MTAAEKRLLADLLNMASNEFGNHGCNDFRRPDYMTQSEWDNLLRNLEEWNRSPEDYEPGRKYSQDFALMDYFAAVLRGEWVGGKRKTRKDGGDR